MSVQRVELRNFLRDLKTKNPDIRYNLAYDKLYVEDKCFQWSESLRKVVLLDETTPVGPEAKIIFIIFYRSLL